MSLCDPRKKGKGEVGRGKENNQRGAGRAAPPNQGCHLVGSGRGQPQGFSFSMQNQGVWSHPGWGNATHTQFCKTWWLNICLNLYLPLGHIFFTAKPISCMHEAKSAVGECTHFNHFSTFSSLTVGVTRSLMSHPLHVLRHSPGTSSTSFKGLVSGCKSQCKWFPCNNFQLYYSFYGQRSTLNKLGSTLNKLSR